MSKYFLPVDSTTSNSEHLRGGDYEKFFHRLSQMSDSAPANRKASMELCGNAPTFDLHSCSSGTSVGVHEGSVNVEQWDVHLPTSCERPREFQVEPSFFPLESIHVSTSEHSTQDIEGSKGERIKLSNPYLDNQTGLRLRDDYAWTRRLQGAEAWPVQGSIKSRFNLSYDCTFRSKDGQLDPSTEIVTRNEPWSPVLNLKVISNSQQCRTGTTFEKLDSADQLRNEEYLSNLLKTSREGYIDPEAQYETVYRTSCREPAKLLQEKMETGHKRPAQTQHQSARVNICITPDPLPFRESDPPELKRRRNCADTLDHTVDLTPLCVQEHGLYSVEEDRIFRPCGGKDRHSKVRTSKGLRDRRVRLSVSTAIQFYDIQDRLGYEQPSKAIDWLMTHAKAAIDELRGSHNPPTGCSATDSRSSLGFKSPINDEIATYSATSHISADSSNSGSVPIGARDGSDELPESQAFGYQGLSISLPSARTNEVSRRSFLQTKEHHTSPNLLRADEQHLWAKPTKKRNSNSSSTSDGSRDHDIETMALDSARSESRANARRRARERTIERHRDQLSNVSGNVFSSKSSPNL